jgi:hypothetical protein
MNGRTLNYFRSVCEGWRRGLQAEDTDGEIRSTFFAAAGGEAKLRQMTVRGMWRRTARRWSD